MIQSKDLNGMFTPRPNFVAGIGIVLLTVVAVGALFTAPAAAQQGDLVQQEEVNISGSVIEIDTMGYQSLTVTNLPAGANISNVKGGTYAASEGSILFGGVQAPPETVSFELDPDNSAYEVGENVTFGIDVVEEPVQLQITTTPLVQQTEVDTNGSVIEIDTKDYQSIAVTNLPANANISNVEDGTYREDDNSILFGGTQAPPDTVSFELNPDNDAYEVGETVSFELDVGPNSPVELELVTTSVPDEISQDVDDVQYKTVNNDGDDELSAPELSRALRAWSTSENRSYNGVEFEATDFSSMLRYWADS